MKKLFIFTVTLLLAQAGVMRADIAVIPEPVSITQISSRRIPFNAAFSIVCKDPALAKISSRTLSRWTGLKFETGAKPATGGPVIWIDSASTDVAVTALGKEGYVLEIARNGAVTLRSSAANGAFYGVQTLVQLLEKNNGGEWFLPVVKIEDSPRFAWRGVMLDCSRHFFPKENVKRLLDLMALHKQNSLHWHLTGDNGWRVEIKKYPKLTAVGGVRAETAGDGQRHGGFYTQADIREIVTYAAERHITVVPEITLPGRCAAALAAHPEFGNTDIPNYAPQVMTRFGTSDYTFGPQDETFQFLAEVMDEIGALFPSKFIHIGGDGAPKKQWNQSPRARAVMKKENLKGGRELQSWFIRRVEKDITSRGKKIVGWDEILDGEISPDAVVMISRGTKHVRQALATGNKIVLSSVSHCHLDRGQGASPEGVKIEVAGGNTPLETVYKYEPIPANTSPDQEKQILGCQATLWSECVANWPKAEYQLFPRAIALAETGWTPKNKKNWDHFSRRLETAHFKRLDFLKVNYRKPDGTPAQPSQPMR